MQDLDLSKYCVSRVRADSSPQSPCNYHISFFNMIIFPSGALKAKLDLPKGSPARLSLLLSFSPGKSFSLFNPLPILFYHVGLPGPLVL